MKRELFVALVIVVAAAVVLAVGIYLIAVSVPRGSPPPLTTAQEWKAPLEKGLTYGEPVFGPTTPLDNANGGLWVINAAREGVIEMNLTTIELGINEDPFAQGNRSLRLDLGTDFGATGGPLEAVYYIVPAKDAATNGSTGPGLLNGAIAFFAGPDFVAADPFNRTVFFRYRLPFTPTWTGEDPASAGGMLIAPTQPTVSVGVLSSPVGPYEYFWASDGNHTVVFEVTYVHAGYCPCSVPSGRAVLFANVSLTAPPFVYYNQFHVDQSTSFRSGPGAAILLALANHTLEVLDTEPRMRGWIPLTLGGQPASVEGNVGFVQTSFPPRLLFPVRSASSTGLVVLDLTGLSKVFEYTAGDASWQSAGAPLSRSGTSIYAAWYNRGDNRTHFVGLNATGVVVPQSVASVPGRAESVFHVSEVNELFVETQAGDVVTLDTTYVTSANVTPVVYPVALPAPNTVVLYAGSPGGTRFGTLLVALEVRGGWTDSASATTALFRLVPLPTPPLAAMAGAAEAAACALSTWAVAGTAVTRCAVRSGRRT
jgi:hypothetical protein